MLAWPAFLKAASMVGRDNLFLFVFPESRPIFDILGAIPPSNIIEIDPSSPASFISSSLRAIAKARRNNIDTVIDMEFFARVGAVLAYLSGAPRRVGLGPFTLEGLYRGDLFTHRLIYNPYIHVGRFFLGLVEAAGMAPAGGGVPLVFPVPAEGPALPVFSPSEEEKESLLKKLETLAKRPLSRPLVIFNPKAEDLLPVRKWPEEHYIRLGRLINESYPGATILITGVREERRQTEAIAVKIGNSISLAGETDLRELLTLYGVSDLLVTSDCGPGIFAAMTPVRSIVLFGPETPELFGVAGAKSVIIRQEMACSPCVSFYNQRDSRCLARECMKGITPEKVFEEARKLLDGSS